MSLILDLFNEFTVNVLLKNVLYVDVLMNLLSTNTVWKKDIHFLIKNNMLYKIDEMPVE